jgi:hypothetical protein
VIDNIERVSGVGVIEMFDPPGCVSRAVGETVRLLDCGLKGRRKSGH